MTTMDWKKYVLQLQKHDDNVEYTFNSPTPHFLFQDLQLQFGLKELPEELTQLYKETNGINETLNGDKIGELIWTVERVMETNKEYRHQPDFKELYMSFDQLLFISDAGNGDLFGYVTLQNRFDRHDIFVWNHEDDSRTWVAPNLIKYIEWWTNGSIKV